MASKNKNPVVATSNDIITFDHLTVEQQTAVRSMQQGHNVHLYGKAGTGKSVTLKAYLDSLSAEERGHTIICAPTGIAAINVGGATIHSTFRAPIDPIGPTEPSDVGVPDVFEAVHRVIIDEISMCRFDLFEYVAAVIHAAEVKYNRHIQLIVCGDFLQLPPVIRTDKEDATKDQKKILQQLWGAFDFGDGYAFISPKWAAFEFVNTGLNQVMRQTGDDEFLANINKARVGDQSCIPFFNGLYGKKPEKAIILTGKNDDANAYNNEEIRKIPNITRYYAEINDPRRELKKTDYPVPELLILGAGARVISTKNGKVYQNGSLGTVTKTNAENRSVTVAFDNGHTAIIEPQKWEFGKYEVYLNDDGKKEVGKRTYATFEQLPLKLGYAITIHKSQGQTYDAAYIYPEAFAKGQEYVALSRCRTREGLVLAGAILPRYLIASKSALEFYHHIDPANYPDPDEILKPMSVDENEKLSQQQRADERATEKAEKKKKTAKKQAQTEKTTRENGPTGNDFDTIGYSNPTDKKTKKQEEKKMEQERNTFAQEQETKSNTQQQAAKPYTVRLDESVKTKLQDFLNDLKKEEGLDASAAMERIIDVFANEQAKQSLPERRLEIENFEGHTKALNDMFFTSMQLCNDTENRISQRFANDIERQKNALSAAYVKIEELTKAVATAEAAKELSEKDAALAKQNAESEIAKMQLTLDNTQNVIDKYKAEAEALTAKAEKEIAEAKAEATQKIAEAHDEARELLADSEKKIAKLEGKIEAMQEREREQEKIKKANKKEG